MKSDLAALGELLGDTRVRFRHHQTPYSSLQQLIDIDREIRNLGAQPLSDAVQLEARRLTARLRALDPR